MYILIVPEDMKVYYEGKRREKKLIDLEKRKI